MFPKESVGIFSESFDKKIEYPTPSSPSLILPTETKSNRFSLISYL